MSEPANDYTSRHIPGAIDINYESTNFKKNVSKLTKKKQYLVYCATGVDGAAATQMMSATGFKNVDNISGGMRPGFRQDLLPAAAREL